MQTPFIQILIIAEIDKKLTEQVNQILHHEDFQKIEGSWRGLHHLINNTETDEMLKIRVMNISKKELGKTLFQRMGRMGLNLVHRFRSTFGDLRPWP